MPVLHVNGKTLDLDIPLDTPLLWVLRDKLGLTATKYGCGINICGACTVLLDGAPMRSCGTPIGAVQGREVTTLEGLQGHTIGAVKAAWEELDVVQCGYCQSGQIITAMCLLDSNPQPTDDDIDAAMAENLCRCGTYHRIRAAIHRAAEILAVAT